MSDFSDDEFDTDWIDNASRRVQSKWSKNVNDMKMGKTKEEAKTSPSAKPATTTSAPALLTSSTPARPGKENKKVVVVVEASDSDVSLTPPGSPNTPTPVKTKAVRGANRTNKTKQALAKLKRTADIEAAVVRKKDRSMNGSLALEEDCQVVSGEEEEVQEVKVRWKAEVKRVVVTPGERAGKLMDRLAEQVGLRPGALLLYRGEESKEAIGREEEVGDLGLTVASVLLARARVAGQEEGGLEVRLQTKDRRSQPVVVRIQATDKMSVLVQGYLDKTGLARSKVKFFFEGDLLEEDQTAEDLELEGGECVDVHLVD